MRRSEIVFTTLLLLLAAALRLTGIAYGAPEMALHPSDAARNFLPLETPIHPDEYFYVAIPLDMLSKRTLNPDFFENPSFLIYADFVTYALTGAGQGLTPESFRGENQRQFAPFPLYVIGRVYSALGGLLAVAGTYGAARLLGGRFAALCAGLLAAVSLPLVQHAHYATTSSLASGFTMLAVWAALVFWRRGGARWLLLAGAAAGLATANRYNAGAVALLVVGVGLLDLYRCRAVPGAVRRGLLVALGAGAAAGAAFFLANPYSLIRFSRFWEDFRYITSSYVAGRGVRFATPYGLFFELRYLTLFGLGVPAALLALWGTWRLRRSAFALALLGYLLIYALVVLRTVRPGHSDQLLLPIIPVLALFAGVGAAAVNARLEGCRLVTIGLPLLLVLVPLSLTVPVVRAFTLPDTRLVMQEWIYRHLPEGALVHLSGSYNVPLDPALYPWTQTYAADLKPLAELQAEGVEYVVLSDAWFHDEARGGEMLPADYLRELADYLAGYDAFPLIARQDRLNIPGDDWLMHTASAWHHPALRVYCLTAQACAAVRWE